MGYRYRYRYRRPVGQKTPAIKPSLECERKMYTMEEATSGLRSKCQDVNNARFVFGLHLAPPLARALSQPLDTWPTFSSTFGVSVESAPVMLVTPEKIKGCDPSNNRRSHLHSLVLTAATSLYTMLHLATIPQQININRHSTSLSGAPQFGKDNNGTTASM